MGWARFYKMEFDDAILTFKYVNSTSRDAVCQAGGADWADADFPDDQAAR
ncbi:MAG: hypothetical protein WKG07_21285 [Hymenobacter sp.]